RGGESRAGWAYLHAKRLGLRLLAVLLGDVAVLHHAIDHPVAALNCSLRKAERVVVARRLGKSGKIGAVGDGKLGQRLVTIGLRRSSDTVGAGAEIDLVQIKLEDLLLGERALDADSQDRLLQLALHRLLIRQKEVLGHLLGDGRGADLVAARTAQIGGGGAQDALNVEAAMLIEILVLSRDEGFGDAVRNGAERNVDATLASKLGDQIAVIGMNTGHDRRLVFGEHFVVRQILRRLPQNKRRSTGRRHEDDHACRKHEAEEAQQEAATPSPLLLRRLDRSRNVHGFPAGQSESGKDQKLPELRLW